ncbi:MAG: NAD(P)/FAD-dependent oxidoreductase [Actinobacteria bacterium]|nr:NAD(P)/FAD-dependent oxidoreductase [Actinomycetota bacterium]
MSDYDAIVVGAGIAGLGVATQLQQAGKKTLLLEMYPKAGGRMQSYDLPGGYRVDIGLHMIEMGKKGYCHELGTRVGKEFEWAAFSVTLDLYEGGKWQDMQTFIQLTDEEKTSFIELMKGIAEMGEPDFKAWDSRSFDEWLDRNGLTGSLREVWENMSMIMTTIPDAREQSAGECLYIAREALIKGRAVLIAAYPRGGMWGVIGPLVDAFQEMGGELRLGARVEQVVFEGRKVAGVKVARRGSNPIAKEWRFVSTDLVTAPLVVLALPIWHLDKVLDFDRRYSPLPGWWLKRIEDIRGERTGLLGYIIATRRPLYERTVFMSALKSPRTGLPLQAFAPTAFDPGVAPPDRYLLVTDNVAEPWELEDKFNLARLMEQHWEDVKELYSFEDGEVEFAVPYYTTGCDGLARKPGLTGDFKPDVQAPSVDGLFFAGDTYLGRGLAIEGASRSAILCAERILG